jgi:hypothetical protein
MGGSATTKRRRTSGPDARGFEQCLANPEVARRFLRREEGLRKLGLFKEAWGLLRGAEIKNWEAVAANDDGRTSIVKVGMFVSRVLIEEEEAKAEEEIAPHD